MSAHSILGTALRHVSTVRLLVLVLFAVGLATVPTLGQRPSTGGAEEQTDIMNPGPMLSAASTDYIEFGEEVPDPVYRTFTAPDEGADVDVFAQDCCIRDDVVEIYVDGCLLATVSSINGGSGTHPGETHTVSVGPGMHTVEYRNIISGVGPSGWYVSETLKPFTGAFWCGTCVAPEGGPPIIEGIYGFGTCGPVGKKDPIWGTFGRKPGGVLEADSGEKLEVECGEAGPGLYAFLLHYTSPGGDRMSVGICPFIAGCNSAWFSHSGDNDHNGRPDCFVKTRWISKDYWDNDEPNRWTEEETEDPPLLDWADSLFDIGNLRIHKLDHKFEYLEGPPIHAGACGDGSRPEGDWVRSMYVDPPFLDLALSLASEASASTIAEGALEVASEPPPMAPSPFAFCDLDKDWDCDEADGQLFADALGKCRGEPGYSFDADVDGDGCVVTNDEQTLFPPTISVVLDIKPGSDPNSVNCRRETGVIPVAILTTEDFDAATVDHATVSFEGATETHVHEMSAEPIRHEEDVDQDGDMDLVLHFRLGETNLTCDSTQGTLTGETFEGRAIEGTDAVRLVNNGPDNP